MKVEFWAITDGEDFNQYDGHLWPIEQRGLAVESARIAGRVLVKLTFEYDGYEVVKDFRPDGRDRGERSSVWPPVEEVRDDGS